MENKLIIIGIVVTVVIIVGAFVFFNSRTETIEITEQETEEVRKLYVVTSPWKPYMYEEDGEYVGLAVELLDRIMTELDVAYVFELLPWTRALKMVELGEADIALVATYTSERAEFIRFTPEQVRYSTERGDIPESALVVGEYVFFVRKLLVDSIHFDSMEQVIEDEYRIGVSQDYVYEFLLTNDSRLITKEYADHIEGMRALFAGSVDVFVVEKLVGISTAKDLGLENELTFIELNTDKALFPEYFLYGKNTDYPGMEQLMEDVDRVIVELKRTGEYDEIYNKYLE